MLHKGHELRIEVRFAGRLKQRVNLSQPLTAVEQASRNRPRRRAPDSRQPADFLCVIAVDGDAPRVLPPASSSRLQRFLSFAARASMTTKAWASGASSVMVRW